ncbi:MAG: yfkJ [Gammaproteobacteria bacterium]|nr:yfkJ [Gammaproteobacteria bacterium]
MIFVSSLQKIQPGMHSQIKVLFVCMGNICRSPTGEGVFRHYVAQAGHAESILVDSAGISDYHVGSPSDLRMRQAAVSRGYALTSSARQVTVEDMVDFDLIVAMDEDNLMALERLANGSGDHIRMLGTYLGETVSNARARSVPDPYYGGAAGFEAVLDMIEAACPAMLTHSLELLQAKRG